MYGDVGEGGLYMYVFLVSIRIEWFCVLFIMC